MNDLPGTLLQIRRALKPDGLFLAVLFGLGTLDELRDCLIETEAELHGGASPRVSPFADARDAAGLLQRAGFALPVADVETVTVTYPDALRPYARAGRHGRIEREPPAQRPLRRPRTFRPRRRPLCRAIWRERRTNPGALSPVCFLTGWAPHESQQQAPAPGQCTGAPGEAPSARRSGPAGDRARPK